jgi:hypothetical protein
MHLTMNISLGNQMFQLSVNRQRRRHVNVLSLCDYTNSLVWLLLYAQTPKHIRGGWLHYTDTSEQLMEEYNSERPEQSCLLRWTEKSASLRFCPRGDRTPYLLIRSPPLIDCATGSGRH